MFNHSTQEHIPAGIKLAELIIPGEPLSPVNQYAARAVKTRGRWTAMMYLQSKFQEYKNHVVQVVSDYAKEYNLSPYEDPVAVVAHFYMGTRRRKDLPNAGKLEFDAFNDIIWKDDSQILKLVTEKRYDKENPRTEITVYSFTPEHW